MVVTVIIERTGPKTHKIKLKLRPEDSLVFVDARQKNTPKPNDPMLKCYGMAKKVWLKSIKRYG